MLILLHTVLYNVLMYTFVKGVFVEGMLPQRIQFHEET